ncbi:hypothetical protein [Modestobacter sp. I12A-02662]|uniref:hypothetical protein n=1 Tax=Modestobacter sp. I12A-02662 TaxID=1730496 RepID=UPI0034DF2475
MTAPTGARTATAETPSPTGETPLRAWHRLDWRFLLPECEPQVIACAGALDDDLVSGLPLIAPTVHTVTSPAGWAALAGTCDLVVLASPAPADLRPAAAALRPGGWLYAEVRRGRPSTRAPWTVRGWQRALRRAGLAEVAAHWHVPTIATSSRVIALDARVVLRDVLLRTRRRRFGTALSLAARAALRLGLVPVLVPEGSVVGRRAEEPR